MIMITGVRPEQRDLLDTIMSEWEKQEAEIKAMGKEVSIYQFAYWLIRYSNLVEEKKMED